MATAAAAAAPSFAARLFLLLATKEELVWQDPDTLVAGVAASLFCSISPFFWRRTLLPIPK